MSKRKARRRPDTCTYCGVFGAVTKDHVPPKSLFPPARRKNLLTVPSCESCRQPTGADDEYFKLMFSFRMDLGEGPDAEWLRDGASRALKRPERDAFRRDLRQRLQLFDLHTPTGIFVGTHAAYPVELQKVLAVVQRTIRGLYRRATGRVLPPSAEIAVLPTEMLREKWDDASIHHLLTCTLPNFTQAREQTTADGAFGFRYGLFEPGPEGELSIWLLRFYQNLEFFGIVQLLTMSSETSAISLAD